MTFCSVLLQVDEAGNRCNCAHSSSLTSFHGSTSSTYWPYWDQLDFDRRLRQ